MSNHDRKFKLIISTRLLSILAVNGFLGILLILVACKFGNANNIWNLLLGCIILCVNMLFYLKSNVHQKAELLILVAWELTIIIEMAYRIVRLNATPYRILYVPDILCFLFFIEMSKRIKFKQANNIILLITIVTGTLAAIFNLRNFDDYIHGIMLVIRIWGLYLYSSTISINLPKWTKWVFPVSMVAFFVETAGGFNVDFRNGIFGYEYIGGLFQLLLIIWLSKATVKDLRKKGKNYLWLKVIIVEIIFALREAKVECLLLVVWIFILVLLLRKRLTIKVVMYPILIVAVGIIGWNMIPVISPKWAYVFDNWSFFEIAYGGVLRMFYDTSTLSLSEFLQEEKFSTLNYIFGIGFGAAQPPAYYRFCFLDISGLNGMPDSMWMSSLITKYYNSFSASLVFYRGIYDVIIDLGITGVLAFCSILINCIFKSYKLCRSKDEDSNVIGAVGIWSAVYIFYRMMGYNIVVVPLAMMVFGVLFGMIEYRYRLEYICKK